MYCVQLCSDESNAFDVYHVKSEFNDLFNHFQDCNYLQFAGSLTPQNQSPSDSKNQAESDKFLMFRHA
jgi:hypothetical protein